MFTKSVTIGFLNEPDSILDINTLDEFIAKRIDYDFQFVRSQQRSILETVSIFNHIPCISFLMDNNSLGQYIEGFLLLTKTYKKQIKFYVEDLVSPSDTPNNWEISVNGILDKRRGLTFNSYAEVLLFHRARIKNVDTQIN